MGLMKLATYFRDRGDDVRFFKGDMRDLAVDLLIEEFWQKAGDPRLGEYSEILRGHIKSGKLGPLDDIPEFKHRGEIYEARSRYRSGDHPKFDIVCVTTLFTFYWKETIDAINAAKRFVAEGGIVNVGGIASTILPREIEKDTGIRPYVNDRGGALLDRPGQIDADSDAIIDSLPLDYSILEEIGYEYPASNAYFGYMTRGCVNKCSFCAVPKLEPGKPCGYIGIREQIETAAKRFGSRKDLLLLDNNVLASGRFDKIIDEIKACGFEKGSTYLPSNEYEIAVKNIRGGYNVRAYLRKAVRLYDDVARKLSGKELGDFYLAREKLGILYADTASTDGVLEFDSIFAPLYEKYVFRPSQRRRTRYIDFNQGVDARLITDEKMRRLSEINIRPLRIAFDHWDRDPQHPRSKPMHEIYEQAVRLAAKHGIRHLSNYLLYNTDDDTPDELYLRLKLNVDLCEEMPEIRIHSFPMKYHPIDDLRYYGGRDFIGRSWNRKYIRAIQSILNSTHGIMGQGKSFFEAAFGKTLDQFHEILMMPEAFIIERYRYDREACEAYLSSNGSADAVNDASSDCGDMVPQWRRCYASLTRHQRETANRIIFKNDFSDEAATATTDGDVNDLLKFYRIRYGPNASKKPSRETGDTEAYV
jgi:hypothetical protein